MMRSLLALARRSGFPGPWTGLLLLAALGPSSTALGEGDPDLMRRFLVEAPREWAVLEAADGRIEVVGTELGNNVPSQPNRFHYAQDGPSRFLELAQDQVTAGQVNCLTPDRLFVLSRNTPGGAYVITSLGTGANDPRQVAKGRKVLGERIDKFYTPNQILPHAVNGLLLSTLLKTPTNRLKLVEPVKKDGVDLVRATFTTEYDDPLNIGKRMVVEAQIFLRPDKLWTVQEFRTKATNGYDSTASYIYGEDEDGLPTIKSYQLQATYPVDGVWGTMKQAITYTKYSRRPIPPSAFSLAGFGLPEFERPPGRPAALRPELWFLSLALLFGVVAVALRVGWARSRRPPVVAAS